MDLKDGNCTFSLIFAYSLFYNLKVNVSSFWVLYFLMLGACYKLIGILEWLRYYLPGYNYLRQGGYVIIVIVCLFVCLLATLRKNFWTDVHEIFSKGWQWANEHD